MLKVGAQGKLSLPIIDSDCASFTHPNPEGALAMPREKSPTSSTPRKRSARKAGAAESANAPSFSQFVGPEQRAALIAEAAFFRAEKRGFTPGHEVADWLAAESEVDSQLMHAVETGRRV
jgi:hypothetical protein